MQAAGPAAAPPEAGGGAASRSHVATSVPRPPLPASNYQLDVRVSYGPGAAAQQATASRPHRSSIAYLHLSWVSVGAAWQRPAPAATASRRD